VMSEIPTPTDTGDLQALVQTLSYKPTAQAGIGGNTLVTPPRMSVPATHNNPTPTKGHANTPFRSSQSRLPSTAFSRPSDSSTGARSASTLRWRTWTDGRPWTVVCSAERHGPIPVKSQDVV